MNRLVSVCEFGPRRHVTRDAPQRQEGQPGQLCLQEGRAAPLAGSLLRGQEVEASKGVSRREHAAR